MNVVFLTLFLGLVAGPQEVRVAVGSNVAAVEIRLDGILAARATAPSWAATVDFGSGILPSDLEAIAFDPEKREVGRDRIRVNMPRPKAGASFALGRRDQTGRQMARLSWESSIAASPRTIEITLDGEPLPVKDPSSFEIPPGDPGTVRILRADLRFDNDVFATAEAFIGRNDRDYTSAELTAVPVVLAGRKELPSVSALAGWLEGGSGTLRVIAVEEGPADVVFLVDPGAEPRLFEISREGSRGLPFPYTYGNRRNFRLGKDDFVTFIFPAPNHIATTPYNLYRGTGPFSRTDGGILWLYFHLLDRPAARDAAAFRWAASLTGVAAVQNCRRRAAVWILSSRPPAERTDLETARQYLRALNVPLRIWCVPSDGRPSPPSEGERDVSTLGGLDAAISNLEKALDRQRIVWVEGDPLPQTIAVTPRASGIAIAR